MGGLTWLHLSDWHQGGNEFDRQVVLKALLNDIRERKNISPSLDKVDFIIFSGDVAFSGKSDQYQAAQSQLFQPILEACELDPSQLFIVPGNHDLDMDDFKFLPGDLQKPLASEAEVQTWLTEDKGKSKLLEPFQAFVEFTTNFTGQKQPGYANVQKWQIGDKKIAVVGFNSAWMCGRNKSPEGKISDKGFVLVGEPQIQNIVNEIDDADLKIAVLHHPFDWLAEFDCNRIEDRLRQSFNFILRGHQHRQKVEVIHGTSGDSIIIPAGSCYNRRLPENPLYANSYNFVHLDFDSGNGTVFLRRWSDPRTKWIEDVDSFDGGKFEFHLFESKSATPSQPFESTQKSTQIIPQQIPPPPADFKGREDEITDILSNFEKGATITGIRGMGGIGKTALALVLAEKLKGRFPDGQIFIEMRGTSKNPDMPPVTPEEAMAHIIRAYNPIDRLPNNPNELRGLYHSVLAGKHVLLLLDNAADSEQVEPLLPPASCSVLITSRIKFTLPGLAEKDLDILPSDKAKELLLDIAPRIGDRADELAKLCGYLPIALRNAAKALAEKKDLGVSEYQERLKDKVAARIELVKASFSLSYDLLTTGRKKQWRRLSVFPEDFDRSAATAVLKMAPGPASEALNDLVKWSLVDFNPFSNSEEGRYKLHELARIFAESCLKSDEFADVRLKHSKHYIKVLSEANRLYQMGDEKVQAGIELFDRDWINIKAGQAWAKSMVRISKRLIKSDRIIIMQMASSYAYEGFYLLDLHLPPLDMISWCETGLTAARIIEYRSAEGVNLGHLGLGYSNLGDARKAIEFYEQALVIAQELGEKHNKGAWLSNLGVAYHNLGDARKAIEYYEQALDIEHEIGDKRAEGASLGNLGLAYANLGETRKAIDYHERALIISREIGDKRSEGADLGNLGSAYANLGETRKAIEYHERALIISREIGDKRSEGDQLGNLGSAYANLGETRKAIDYHERALIISREIGDKRSEGADLGNLGSAYANLDETQKAIEYYEQALKIAQETENLMNEGETLCDLGKAYADLNEFEKAIDYCTQSLEIVHRIEYRRIEGESFCNLGKVYTDLGEIAKAIDYSDKSLEIFKKIEYPRGEADALFNKCLALDKLGQRQEAIDHAKAALDIFERIESFRAEKVRQKLAEWLNSGEPKTNNN